MKQVILAALPATAAPGGPALLSLARMSVPKAEKYATTARLLRTQLDGQPRTQEGGFWHTKANANQMWLYS